MGFNSPEMPVISPFYLTNYDEDHKFGFSKGTRYSSMVTLFTFTEKYVFKHDISK